MIKDSFEGMPYCIHAKNLKNLRKLRKESQTDFWSRFGVTQSSGSRFEKGWSIPLSVAILIDLYLEEKISDAELYMALDNNNQPTSLALKVHEILSGHD